MSGYAISGESEARLKVLWDTELTSKDIASLLRVTPATVYRTASRLNLPPRTHAESKKGGYKPPEPKRQEEKAPEIKPKPPARCKHFTGRGDWTDAHDLAIEATGGAYVELNALAEMWAVPIRSVEARWHIVRARK